MVEKYSKFHESLLLPCSLNLSLTLIWSIKHIPFLQTLTISIRPSKVSPQQFLSRISVYPIFQHTLYSLSTVFFHKSNPKFSYLLFVLQNFPIMRSLYGVSKLWLLRNTLWAIRPVFSPNTLLDALWRLTLLNYYLLIFWTTTWSKRDELLQPEKKFQEQDRVCREC
jgi:hypothetical protein